MAGKCEEPVAISSEVIHICGKADGSIGVIVLLTGGGFHAGEVTSCWGKIVVTAGSTCAVDGVGIGPSVVLLRGDVSIPLCGVVTLGCGITTPGIVWEVVVLGLDEESLSSISSTHLGVPSLYPVGPGNEGLSSSWSSHGITC